MAATTGVAVGQGPGDGQGEGRSEPDSNGAGSVTRPQATPRRTLPTPAGPAERPGGARLPARSVPAHLDHPATLDVRLTRERRFH